MAQVLQGSGLVRTVNTSPQAQVPGGKAHRPTSGPRKALSHVMVKG